MAERHRELSLLSVLSLRKPHLGEVTRTATNCSSAAGVSGLRLRQLEGPKAVSPGTRGRPRRGTGSARRRDACSAFSSPLLLLEACT